MAAERPEAEVGHAGPVRDVVTALAARPGVAGHLVAREVRLGQHALGDLHVRGLRVVVGLVEVARQHGGVEGRVRLDGERVYAHVRRAEAHRLAHACDPVSAFGGVIAVNRPVSVELARQIVPIFTEVVLAPDYEEGALEVLSAKKNLRVLQVEPPARGSYEFKQISGGLLVLLKVLSIPASTSGGIVNIMISNLALGVEKTNWPLLLLLGALTAVGYYFLFVF